jgi:hypothetical protein
MFLPLFFVRSRFYCIKVNSVSINHRLYPGIVFIKQALLTSIVFFK